MKLVHLEPQFIQYFEEGVAQYLRHVPDLGHAQGVQFLCPVCFVRNGGAVGTHLIEVTFAGKGVKDHLGSHNNKGKPSRWTASGTGYADLTLKPSILIDPAKPACDGWHGFVTNGEAA
jgi:hypothetical protein